MVGPENISYLLNPDCVVLNKGSRGSKENYTSIRWVINHVITDYPIGTGKADAVCPLLEVIWTTRSNIIVLYRSIIALKQQL